MVLNLGSIDVTMDAYMLDLEGLDVIPRFALLETLWEVFMNWKEITMIFHKKFPHFSLQTLLKCYQKWLFL